MLGPRRLTVRSQSCLLCNSASHVPFIVCGNTLQVVNLGSFFTIGLGYAIGIIFALVTAAATSGGHFNPGVTLCFVLFKGFPKPKALAYICAQILGGMIACLLVYAQWRDMILVSSTSAQFEGHETLTSADIGN